VMDRGCVADPRSGRNNHGRRDASQPLEDHQGGEHSIGRTAERISLLMEQFLKTTFVESLNVVGNGDHDRLPASTIARSVAVMP
jgi:hypothetical protein